ncbi:MAG: hypothetical protein O3C39_06830 [Planctomycetota bacterium]|jgi:hypothetical protein|nr:hypothetical protein [Pirellulales bacterium]MDA0255157.1 hypothetical protein [Planctomycetota bacterium]MDA1201384.1 hypothetical protein [Planctomycetota bacterium]
MRTLVLLGLVVGGLIVAGAVHISQNNGQIEVSIDKQKVSDVAGKVATEGEEIIRRAASQAGNRTK